MEDDIKDSVSFGQFELERTRQGNTDFLVLRLRTGNFFTVGIDEAYRLRAALDFLLKSPEAP